MAFNQRLKEARINARLTQEQLAERIGVAKSTLSGYENGNREPSVAIIAKAMQILQVDANYLYQDEMGNLTWKNTEVLIGMAENWFSWC